MKTKYKIIASACSVLVLSSIYFFMSSVGNQNSQMLNQMNLHGQDMTAVHTHWLMWFCLILTFLFNLFIWTRKEKVIPKESFVDKMNFFKSQSKENYHDQ